MARIDQLHELIHALSPSEKRYMKLYFKRNALKDGSNYALLFDHVVAMETYDEVALKKQLNNPKLNKQLHVTKHYLYGHILKGLEQFHHQSDIDKRLSSYKTQIQILQDRNLYQQAKKLTAKALKLARDNERFMDVATLTLWQSNALTRELELRNLEQRLEKLHEQIENALVQQQLRMRLEYLDNKALLFIKKYGMVRDEGGLDMYRSIVEDSSMNPEELHTFLQRYFYHHIMSLYHFATENETENYHHRKELVLLFEQNPKQKKAHESKYITALNNLALVCNQQGKEAEFEHTTAVLERIEARTEEDRARVFTNAYTMRLMDGFGKKNYGQMMDYTPGILSKLEAFGDQIDLSNRILFRYLLAAAHLAAGKDKEALKLLHELLQTPRAEEIQDLYRYARMLLLMAHYTLGNREVLETQTTSLYAYLRTKKKMYRAESLLLELMNELVRQHTKEKEQQAFKRFSTEYAKLMQDAYERRVSSYFPFGDWVEGFFEESDE